MHVIFQVTHSKWMHTNKLNYFIFQVTHSNVTSVKLIKVKILNRPLSKMPTDTIELCNYSFDMQPNPIMNACHPVYQ